jgi:phosphoenolpyruvate carboxykinase (ATP)
MLERGVLPMHASVVVDARGRTTIMWGLSGTGKTTHSMNPKFRLVGDDEHGWGPDGVFNFEGGVYAKTQDLDPNKERYIHAATQRFGTTLENVHIDPVSLRPDFYNTSYTPNGRASFSLDAIPGCVTDEIVSHPENGIFLTADAYGVLPPIARLDRGQDLYWFYLGYTSKLAGTERGLSKNPEPVFSALFGQPFFPRHFEEYVRMFERLVKEHNTRVWLVNTGWTGGPYGTGHRIDIADSMAMIDAVTNGSLDEVPFTRDPVFGFDIPESCPNVASSILSPRSTWHSSEAYDRARAQLAKRFIEKAKQLDMPRDILKGGPQTS